jgi:hypothetical protein
MCYFFYCRNLWCRSHVCGMDQRDHVISSLGSSIPKHLTTYWSYSPVIHLFKFNLIHCLGHMVWLKPQVSQAFSMFM